jgi:hypothetical protein
MLMTRCLKHLKDLKAAGKFGRLTIEITLILLIKVFLLWLLWALFFSHPIKNADRQEAATRMLLNKPQGNF